jgi:hypothetical protein
MVFKHDRKREFLEIGRLIKDEETISKIVNNIKYFIIMVVFDLVRTAQCTNSGITFNQIETVLK